MDYLNIQNRSQNDADASIALSASNLTIICIISLIILIIVLGNALVITAVVKDRRLRHQVQNWLIVSLAAADLLVGFPIMPLTLTYQVKGRWLFGRLLCEIWLASDVLFVTASILNLCAISLDRYFSISRPVSYPAARNLRRMSLCIGAVWLLALAVSLPPLVGWRHDPESRRPGACEVSDQMAYVLYSSCGSFFIPVVIIIMVYCKIYVITRRRARRRKNAEHKYPAKNVLVVVAADTTIVPIESSTEDRRVGNSGLSNPHTLPHTSFARSKRPLSVKMGFKKSKDDRRMWNMSLKLAGEPKHNLLKMERCLSLRFSTSSDRTDDKHSDGSSILDHEPLSPIEPAITKIAPNDSSCDLTSGNRNQSVKKSVLSPQCSTLSSVNGHSRRRLTSFLMFNRRSADVKNATQVDCTENAGRCSFVAVASSTTTDAALVTTSNASNDQRIRQKLRRRRDRQATIVLGSILLAFILCWLPFFTIYVLNAVCCAAPPPVFDFFFWLGYCNSALNPFIYNYFNVEYRRAFRKILSCKSTSV